MSLYQNQLENLIRLSSEWVKTLEVKVDPVDMSEPSFTGLHLLPKLQTFVQQLKKPQLYVRGDGGPASTPVVWDEVALFPDLSIVSSQEKYLAFEVKFLRQGDPGGSLTKAIGQTLMYSNLGFNYSFGLIFDIRRYSDPAKQIRWQNELMSGENFSIQLYK